jgi:hypothetical protein
MTHMTHTHTLSENIIFISTSFRNRWFFSCTVPQMNFIFSDKLHILYLSCNVKKPQTQPPNSLKKAETSVVLTVFWWCYRFLSSLKMHLITGELYLDQWQYITKLNLINAVWLLKQNQSRINIKDCLPRSERHITRPKGRVICLSDLGNMLAYYWTRPH